MTLATLLDSVERPVVGMGFLTRIRAWFTAEPVQHSEMSDGARSIGEVSAYAADTSVCHAKPREAAVLRFPIRGEALLVKLADLLRARLATVALSSNPFLVTMSRAPRSRLLIDTVSSIEFDPGRSAFHVVLQASPETTLTLDTTDFDSLVQFVVEYVNGRISECRALEVAS